MAVSDERLAAQAQQGDTGAFDQLAGRYYHRWLAIAGAVTHDAHDAQDAVQEAMLRMWRHRRGYDPARGWSSWAGTVTHHAALDVVSARAGRWGRTAGTALLEDRPSVCDTQAEALARIRLDGTLVGMRGLGGNRRPALLLSACGVDYETIGRVLGVTPGAARVAACQARRRLARVSA